MVDEAMVTGADVLAEMADHPFAPAIAALTDSLNRIIARRNRLRRSIALLRELQQSSTPPKPAKRKRRKPKARSRGALPARRKVGVRAH